MPEFKDINGRTWSIDITVGAIARIERMVGVNLARINEPRGDSTLLTDMSLDVLLRVKVIYAAISPQAAKANISDEEFGESLGGAALHDATVALWESLAFFFQTGARKDLAAAIRKQAEILAATATMQAERIEAIKMPGDSASSSPGSSESTPPRTP